MVIYKTTNIVNGLIYIGQKRYHIPSYLGGGVLLRKAVKEFGRQNFKHEAIVEGDFNKEFTNYLEKHYIRLYNSQHPTIGYNLMNGGKSLCQHSESSKEKARQGKLGNTWNKGRKPTDFNREMVIRAVSKPKSDYVKQKMFEGRKEKGFQNIGARGISKEKLFDILIDRHLGLRRKEISIRHSVKLPFLTKIFYNEYFYRNWKSDFAIGKW